MFGLVNAEHIQNGLRGKLYMAWWNALGTFTCYKINRLIPGIPQRSFSNEPLFFTPETAVRVWRV